jgi:hypothetical protein
MGDVYPCVARTSSANEIGFCLGLPRPIADVDATIPAEFSVNLPKWNRRPWVDGARPHPRGHRRSDEKPSAQDESWMAERRPSACRTALRLSRRWCLLSQKRLIRSTVLSCRRPKRLAGRTCTVKGRMFNSCVFLTIDRTLSSWGLGNGAKFVGISGVDWQATAGWPAAEKNGQSSKRAPRSTATENVLIGDPDASWTFAQNPRRNSIGSAGKRMDSFFGRLGVIVKFSQSWPRPWSITRVTWWATARACAATEYLPAGDAKD